MATPKGLCLYIVAFEQKFVACRGAAIVRFVFKNLHARAGQLVECSLVASDCSEGTEEEEEHAQGEDRQTTADLTREP